MIYLTRITPGRDGATARQRIAVRPKAIDLILDNGDAGAGIEVHGDRYTVAESFIAVVELIRAWEHVGVHAANHDTHPADLLALSYDANDEEAPIVLEISETSILG